MLITTHVLSGAVVGRLAPSPVSALVAGVVSHFLLDAVPHFGVSREHLLKVAVPDGLTGLAAIAAVAGWAAPQHRITVLAGVAGACLPDLDKPGEVFFGRSPFPAALDRWHDGIQDESPRRLPQELGVMAGSALLTRRLLQRR